MRLALALALTAWRRCRHYGANLLQESGGNLLLENDIDALLLE